MGFSVTYTTLAGGSVVFPLAHVAYRGQAVYDGTGRTLQGYNLIFAVSAVVPLTPTPNLTHYTLGEIRTALVEPRGLLTIMNDSTVLWQVGAPGSGATLIDRNWGPKPMNLTFTEILNGRSAKITMEFSTVVNYYGSNASDIDEFWWAFSYDQDEDFKTIRTITGRVHARSTVDLAGTVMAAPLFWPTLPKGFKRARTNYRLSPDGQTFDFQVVDRQMWRTLPAPLTAGHATFHVARSNLNLTKTLQCQFSAPPDIPKKAIYDYLIALGNYYFPILAASTQANQGKPQTNQAPAEFLTNFTLDDSLFDNTMSMTISTLTQAISAADKDTGSAANGPTKIKLNVMAGLFRDVKDMPNADPKSIKNAAGDDVPYTPSNGTSYLEGVGGSAGLIPQTNGPIAMNTGASAAGTENKGGVTPASNGTNPAGDGTSLQEKQSSFWSNGQSAYPYVTYVESWRYILNRNLELLKVTADTFPTAAPRDIIQQTCSPSMMIIQMGSARRLGAAPVVPYPPNNVLTTESTRTLSRGYEEVTEHAPRVMADGATLEFSTAWCFKYIATWPLINMADLAIPVHPALSNATVNAYQVKAAMQYPNNSDGLPVIPNGIVQMPLSNNRPGDLAGITEE